jgi:hypothetical protein
VLARGRVLGVDGSGERSDAGQCLGLLDLRLALLGAELVEDDRVVDPGHVAPVGLAPVQRGVGETQQVISAARVADVAHAGGD